MNKLLFILSLFGMLALAGCCKRGEDIYLQYEQRELITRYNEDDTLYYVSNLADTDTFIVREAFLYEETRSFPCNFVTEIGRVDFSSPSSYDAGSIAADAEEEYKVILSWLDFEAEPPLLSTPNNSVTIGNTTYNAVYIAQYDLQNAVRSKVVKLYFTTTEGVLRYDLNSGETFEYMAQ